MDGNGNMPDEKGKKWSSRFFFAIYRFITSVFHVKIDGEKKNFALSLIQKLIIFGWIALFFYWLQVLLLDCSDCNYFKTLMGCLLVTGAALVVGGLTGFLFGIPRTVQSAKTDDDGNENYVSNTNLEQISDWLTKIIVGLGLTQITKIPAELDALGLQLAPVFGSGNIGWIAALATVIYFLINGFLFGYLWTRIYFKVVLQRVNSGMEQELAGVKAEIYKMNLEKEANKENKLRRLEKEVAEPQTQPSQDISRGDEMLNEGFAPTFAENEVTKPIKKIGDITNKLDPQKGRFGGIETDDGLMVNATVTNHPSISGLFNVKVWVEPVAGSNRELTGEVVFYLHDTFDPPIIKEMAINNKAEINLVAWGAFTVGVVADNGTVLLEKDLAQLPNAPVLFKTR
jgi:hypothetical protein